MCPSRELVGKGRNHLLWRMHLVLFLVSLWTTATWQVSSKQHKGQDGNSWPILKSQHLHEMTCLRKILATECDKGQPSQREGDKDWGEMYVSTWNVQARDVEERRNTRIPGSHWVSRSMLSSKKPIGAYDDNLITQEEVEIHFEKGYICTIMHI